MCPFSTHPSPCTACLSMLIDEAHAVKAQEVVGSRTATEAWTVGSEKNQKELKQQITNQRKIFEINSIHTPAACNECVGYSYAARLLPSVAYMRPAQSQAATTCEHRCASLSQIYGTQKERGKMEC